jgi:hypothetical protein
LALGDLKPCSAVFGCGNLNSCGCAGAQERFSGGK